MSNYWTPARDAALTALWPHRDKSLSVIAQALSEVSAIDSRIMSGGYISQRAKELKLPPRVTCNRTRSARPVNNSYLMNEAKKRGIPFTELIRRIVAIVDSDKMVDAILDDQHSIAPVAPVRAY